MMTYLHAVGAILLLAAMATVARSIVKGFERARRAVPDVAVLLLIGILVGATAGWLRVPLAPWIAPAQNSMLLTAAASLIISYGGAELSPAIFFTIWKPVLSLATIGVLVSTLCVGTIAWAFGIGSFVFTMLLGALLSGTDPAVLVSVLSQVRLVERMREMLIGESALNDPTSALLASVMLSMLQNAGQSLWQIVLRITVETIIAIFIGIGTGVLMRVVSRYTGFVVLKLVLTFSVAFVVSILVGASPFLAAFTAGFIAQPLTERKPVHSRPKRFHAINHGADHLMFFTRSYVFLTLGLSIHGIGLSGFVPALIVVLVLLSVARPLSIFVVRAIVSRHMSRKEVFFLSLNRQTGVMPALFANLLLQQHVQPMNIVQWSVTITIVITSVILLPFFGSIAKSFKMSTP